MIISRHRPARDAEIGAVGQAEGLLQRREKGKSALQQSSLPFHRLGAVYQAVFRVSTHFFVGLSAPERGSLRHCNAGSASV